MGKVFKDRDIMEAMIRLLDEENIVYGANGHYAIGAYYDLFEDYASVSGTPGATAYYDCEGMDEGLKKALWLYY